MIPYGGSENIDITGIPENELLVALYHGTRPLGLGFLHNNEAFGLEQAREWLTLEHNRGERVYFDYVAGHPIKTGWERSDGATVIRSSALYNRDAGHGTMERVIADLRARFPKAT